MTFARPVVRPCGIQSNPSEGISVWAFDHHVIESRRNRVASLIGSIQFRKAKIDSNRKVSLVAFVSNNSRRQVEVGFLDGSEALGSTEQSGQRR